MQKTALAATLALAPLAGCHAERTTKEIQIVVTPDFSASTATVQCVSSSTEKCRLVFMGPAGTSELMVHQGASGTAGGISEESQFCVDVNRPDAAACRKNRIPAKRATVRVKVTNGVTDSD